MTFAIFLNGHFGNGYFREKFKKSYIGWIRKNPSIHPHYYFHDFHLKIQLRLENENIEISWNSALNRLKINRKRCV